MAYFDTDKITELYPGAEELMIPAMKYLNPTQAKIDAACASGEWFAQPKIDGGLYMATLTPQGDYLFSRTPSKKNGLLVDKHENVPHIMNMFLTLPKNTVILGEIYYPGGTSKDVTSIMGCLPKKAIERQSGEYGEIHYYMHDILWYSGVDLIKGKATNWERYNILAALSKQYNLESNPYIHLAPLITENIKAEAARIIAEGGEGVVIKRRDGIYEPDKRPQSNYKIKSVDTVDVVCMGALDPTKEYAGKDLESWEYWGSETGEKALGFYYGKSGYSPVTKAYYNGWKTAIRIGLYDADGALSEIGTVASGLTDWMRADLADNPQNYIGSVVEVQCMSKDAKEKTLRHPFIIRFRDDKPATDCTFTATF